MDDLINLPREREIIAKVLNIVNDGSWQIIDKFDDLRLVYYTKKKSKIRGQIVDIEEEKLVVDVYGQSDSPIIEVITSKINDNFKITDVDMNEYHLDNVKIEKGVEGCILRCFKYKNQIYYATHKKIDSKNSRWIVGPTFLEMYTSLNGPDLIFTGNEVHYFLLAHAGLQQASNNFLESKLYYLETKGLDNLISDDLALLFPREKEITFQEANHHLQPVEMDDYRSEDGDFLILRAYDKNRNTNFIFKVLSRSYNWRLSIVNNDPNIQHLWYYHTNSAIIGTKFTIPENEFVKKYLIPENLYSTDELKNTNFKNAQFSDFSYKKIEKLNQSNRYSIIFFNLLFALPRHRREDLFSVHQDYFESKRKLALKIYDDYVNGVNYDPTEDPGFGRIRNYAIKYSRFNDRISNVDMFTNIQKLINTEFGTSLYRMVKSI